MISYPPLPNLNTCHNLTTSTYVKKEYISEVKGNFNRIQIESNLIGDKFVITKKINCHYYDEFINDSGLFTTIRSNEREYIEYHYSPGDLDNPIYGLVCKYEIKTHDLISKIEMTVSSSNNVKHTKYSILDRNSLYNEEIFLRFELVKREISYWQNKKGKYIKAQHLVFVENEYKKEVEAFFKNGKWKTYADTALINLKPWRIYYFHYEHDGLPWFNLDYYVDHVVVEQEFSKKRMINHIPSYKDRVRKYNYDHIKIENSRQQKYIKWISKDSLEVYELRYRK